MKEGAWLRWAVGQEARPAPRTPTCPAYPEDLQGVGMHGAQAALFLLPWPLGQGPLLLWPPAWLCVQPPQGPGPAGSLFSPLHPGSQVPGSRWKLLPTATWAPVANTPALTEPRHSVAFVDCFCDTVLFLGPPVSLSELTVHATLRLSFAMRVSASLAAGPRAALW